MKKQYPLLMAIILTLCILSPTNAQAGSVNLPQTYTNETEGFSFDCPAGWVIEIENDGGILVLISNNSDTDPANVVVEKFFDSHDLFEFTETDFREELLLTFDEAKIDRITENDLGAKMVIFTAQKNGIYFTGSQTFFPHNNLVYSISFSSLRDSFDRYAPIFDAIISSLKIYRTEESYGRGSVSNPKVYTLGDTFGFNDLEITLGTSFIGKIFRNSFSVNDGRSVLAVPVTVKNLRADSHGLNPFDITLYGSKGTELENLAYSFEEDDVSFSGKMRSGVSQKGYLHFLYDGDGEYAVEFCSYMGEPTTVSFLVTADGNSYYGNRDVIAGNNAGNNDSSGNTPNAQREQANVPQTEPTAQTPTMSRNALDAIQIYIDHINEVRKSGDWSDEYGEMSLIYIDDDDIPELFIDYGSSAAGGVLYTVSGGKLKNVPIYRGGLTYIERKSLFVNDDGNMGNYYDIVYTLQNGEFTMLHKGEYGEKATNDEEAPYAFYWRWDGEEVSESDYSERFRLVFDGSKAKSPRENTCSASDMLQILNGLLQANASQPTGTNASSLIDLGVTSYFVERDDDIKDNFLPSLKLFPDGSFTFLANLYAGMGIMQGSYSLDGGMLVLHASQSNFRGFSGDDVETFTMRIEGDSLIYLQDNPIGMTGRGSIFYKSPGIPASFSSYDSEYGEGPGDGKLDWLISNGHVPQYVRDKGTFHYDPGRAKVMIKGNGVRLRSQPNTDARIITSVNSNAVFDYHGEWTQPKGEKWVLVASYFSSPDTEDFMWVHGNFAEPVSQEQYDSIMAEARRRRQEEAEAADGREERSRAEAAGNQTRPNGTYGDLFGLMQYTFRGDTMMATTVGMPIGQWRFTVKGEEIHLKALTEGCNDCVMYFRNEGDVIYIDDSRNPLYRQEEKNIIRH